MDARRVLADVAGLGPFFAVGTGPAVGAGPGWRPMRELYTDPQPLRDRIAHVRRVLGSDDRVAASITFQALAALVVSAPFAAVVLHGVLPRMTADSLLWRRSEAGSWELRCADAAVAPVCAELSAHTGAAAAALAEALFAEHLVPLVTAVRAQVPISPRVLWGSVGSSVAAAKRLVGVERPAAAAHAAAVAEGLLGLGPLAGTGELLAPSGPDRAWTFRRRSCCLYYRVPGGDLCGDCVLLSRR